MLRSKSRSPPRGVCEGLHHVLLVKVRVGAQDLRDGPARRDVLDDGPHCHARATNARLPAHHIYGARDTVE